MSYWTSIRGHLMICPNDNNSVAAIMERIPAVLGRMSDDSDTVRSDILREKDRAKRAAMIAATNSEGIPTGQEGSLKYLALPAQSPEHPNSLEAPDHVLVSIAGNLRGFEPTDHAEIAEWIGKIIKEFPSTYGQIVVQGQSPEESHVLTIEHDYGIDRSVVYRTPLRGMTNALPLECAVLRAKKLLEDNSAFTLGSGTAVLASELANIPDEKLLPEYGTFRQLYEKLARLDAEQALQYQESLSKFRETLQSRLRNLAQLKIKAGLQSSKAREA